MLDGPFCSSCHDPQGQDLPLQSQSNGSWVRSELGRICAKRHGTEKEWPAAFENPVTVWGEWMYGACWGQEEGKVIRPEEQSLVVGGKEMGKGPGAEWQNQI